jgi:hypothetical protein
MDKDDGQLDGLWGWSGAEKEKPSQPAPPPAQPPGLSFPPLPPLSPPPDDGRSYRSGTSPWHGNQARPLVSVLVIAFAMVATGLAYTHKNSGTPTPVSPTSATAVPSTFKNATMAPPTADNPQDTATPQDRDTVTPQDAETDALQRLEDLRRGDLASVTFDGRWIAQLASKYVGIHDPLQTNASGGHVFTAADILAEHLALRKKVGTTAQVILLQRTDYGANPNEYSQKMWVTFALGNFPSGEAVKTWCAQQFPELTGSALSNACASRRLNPPGG